MSFNENHLEVMRQCRSSSGYTDPRDLIYSRRALFPSSPMVVPHPDYTISVEELYKRFAVNCIMLTHSLEVITFATKSASGWPSWVPDWSTVYQEWTLGAEFEDVSHAIKNSPWRETGLPRVSRDRIELMVQGRALFPVPDHGRAFKSRFMSSDMLCMPSEIPRSKLGDTICVLKGCPSFVCLREEKDHHVIVGRTPVLQSIIAQALREQCKGSYTNLQNALAGIEVVYKIR